MVGEILNLPFDIVLLVDVGRGKLDGWQEMIFFFRFSSSTAFSIWQPKNARQTLGDKLVCI
jgi:hypothetical protein